MYYLKTKFPMTSNMGGWENQIYSALNILNSLLRTHGVSLNDKSLSTLLVEVEGIFNSMTITCESTGDVNT